MLVDIIPADITLVGIMPEGVITLADTTMLAGITPVDIITLTVTAATLMAA